METLTKVIHFHWKGHKQLKHCSRTQLYLLSLDSNKNTYASTGEGTDRYRLDRPGNRLPTLPDGVHVGRPGHGPGHSLAALVQLFAQLLHAPEETLALVQGELGLRECAVEDLFAPEMGIIR